MSSPEESVEAAKQQMLEEHLRRRGITAQNILRAMHSVPRELFTPHLAPEQAYADRAWSIDCEQTISQPFIVGIMSQALQLTGKERVLEIGTGSGYQTAVLSKLAAEVFSVERHRPLAVAARETLNHLKADNVHLLVGDGTLGYPPQAPYDAIIVTAATSEIPPALKEQLAESGRLVIPLGDKESQTLQVFTRQSGQFTCQDLTSCRFVPLIPAPAENED